MRLNVRVTNLNSKLAHKVWPQVSFDRYRTTHRTPSLGVMVKVRVRVTVTGRIRVRVKVRLRVSAAS